jgi:DNA-binding response OmpR family regulator
VFHAGLFGYALTVENRYTREVENVSEHLLVVDDDRALRDRLSRYLTGEGFRVTAVADGPAMDAFLAKQTPDAVILDLMLPGEDGLSLARRLRAERDLPIIMLSARGEDIDRIIGLEIGADDYLAKPFNPRELLARIRALLRRHTASAGAVQETVYTFGPYRLDVTSHAFTRHGDPVALTAAEFTLLRVFTEHPNRVLSRDLLVDLIKGYDRSPFDRSIDVRVTRLRRKIEDDPASPRYIRTIWGEGYLFSPKGETPG